MIQGMLLEEGVPSILKRSPGFDVPDFLAAGPRDVMVPEGGYEAAREVLLQADLAPREGPGPVRADGPRALRLTAVIAGRRGSPRWSRGRSSSSVADRPLRLATFLAPRMRPLYEAAAEAVGAELVDGEAIRRPGGRHAGRGVPVRAAVRGARAAWRRWSRRRWAAASRSTGPRSSRARARGRRRSRSFAGRRLAVNEPDSHSGSNVVLATLAERGVPPGGSPRWSRRAATRRRSRPCVSGDADVAAIDSHLFAALAADGLGGSRAARAVALPAAGGGAGAGYGGARADPGDAGRPAAGSRDHLGAGRRRHLRPDPRHARGGAGAPGSERAHDSAG